MVGLDSNWKIAPTGILSTSGLDFVPRSTSLAYLFRCLLYLVFPPGTLGFDTRLSCAYDLYDNSIIWMSFSERVLSGLVQDT